MVMVLLTVSIFLGTIGGGSGGVGYGTAYRVGIPWDHWWRIWGGWL